MTLVLTTAPNYWPNGLIIIIKCLCKYSYIRNGLKLINLLKN